MAITKNFSQEEANDNTIKLMERIISDIKNGNINVEQFCYGPIKSQENPVLEVVLDKYIGYGQIRDDNQ